MSSLRDAAMAAAEGRPVPAYNPQAVPPQETTEDSKQAKRPNDPIFASPASGTGEDPSKFGTSVVYVARQNQNPPMAANDVPNTRGMTMEQGAQMLMGSTPVQKVVENEKAQNIAPVASSIGLDANALDSSVPGSVEEPSAAVLYAQLQYNPDGSFSPGQMKLVVEHLKDVPSEQYYEITKDLFSGVETELTLMITQAHLSVNAAQKASYNRVIAELDQINEVYKREHPERASIIIDKTQDVNDLGLTSEEHAKLEKAKKVRLVLLEDVDLANIEFEHPPENHVADYIKSIEGSLAKYSVPLPMLGDFISLKGAQIVQMYNIVRWDDSKVDEILNTKASLIYDKLIGGSVLTKFNEFGENRMSYMEFINKFPYNDVDMAIFGILCASSLEESSTSITCQHCQHTWMEPYNLKNLLRLDNVPESIKERTDEILKNKTNGEALRKLYEEKRRVKRYQSPFTKNVYDLSYPTVARALDLLKRVDANDEVASYYSAMALYFNQIGIYNSRTGKYVSVPAEKPDLVLDTLKTLSNEDMNLIANKISEDFLYRPEFLIEVTCPSCGKVARIPLEIDNLIFLKAQDSVVEIV